MHQKEHSISYIAKVHGKEAARLTQAISHAFASVGRGRFADRVIVSLADLVENGDLRMSNRGFVYSDSATGRDIALGEKDDEVLSALAFIAVTAHRSSKGSIFSRIARRLIPRSIIEDNIRGVSPAVYKELMRREDPSYRGARWE